MNKISKYLLAGIVALGMTACANLDLTHYRKDRVRIGIMMKPK